MASLLEYRQALAQALDDWGGYGVGQATVGSASLVGLLDATTGASANRFNGAWAYSPRGGDQRRVVTGGYVPSQGRINVELNWTLPQAGDTIEITHLFPCYAAVSPEATSYATLVNNALARLLVPRRLAFSATTADTYTTGVLYPWLDRESRIPRDDEGRLLVWESSPVAGRHPIPSGWRGWTLILNGAATALQSNVPFSAPTGTVYLDVLSPADTFVNGAESATGLADDNDTALASVNDVVEVGLEEAYLVLMNRNAGTPSGQWAQKYVAQQKVVDGLYYLDRTQRRPAAPVAEAA